MIKPNHWADLVIFDYETIADNATTTPNTVTTEIIRRNTKAIKKIISNVGSANM